MSLTLSTLHLAAAALSLRRQQLVQRPSAVEAWLLLPARVRCLLGSGWILGRVENLVLRGGLSGWTPDELADEIWRLEVTEFPHPDQPHKPRANFIGPWVEILRGERACTHVGHADRHVQPPLGRLIALHALLEPLAIAVDNGVEDPRLAYYLRG